jgi:preprotein translocase subunit SecB
MNNSQFQFKGYRIQKSIIEILETGDDDMSLDFELSGHISIEKGLFLLTLTTKIHNKLNKINIEVTIIGKFKFPKESVLEDLNGYFYINAPALLFPYVRAYISTLTNLSGIKPITLPTLNLTELGKTLKDKTIVE